MHKGEGGPLGPGYKQYFSVGIFLRNSQHMCIHLDNHKSGKNKKGLDRKASVSKWRPKYKFSFHKNNHMTKIWKTTFPKEFFNKMLLRVEECESIYIAEIKFWKKIYLKMAAKQFLPHPKMLIYANNSLYFPRQRFDLIVPKTKKIANSIPIPKQSEKLNYGHSVHHEVKNKSSKENESHSWCLHLSSYSSRSLQ